MKKPDDSNSLLQRIAELEEEKRRLEDKVREYESDFEIRESDMEGTEDFTFQSLFDLEAIQQLQDQFARAARVGSIITTPDGTPLTRPSNFCRLCQEIIRNNPKGRQNCFHSDAIIGRHSSTGPTIQRCISGGLWDAGAAIVVGGKHIASWLMGQSRDSSMEEEDIRRYAREIEADEDEMAEAYHLVPSMDKGQFDEIANLLFVLANQLSDIAYQNYQKAENIRKNKRMTQRLTKNEAYLRTVISSIPDVLWIKDPEGTLLYCNPRFENLLGLPAGEIIGRKDRDFLGNPGKRSLWGEKGFPDETRGIFQKEEVLLFQNDGHRETADIIKVPIAGKDGRLMGYLGMGRDVTAYKELEKEHLDNIRFFQDLDRINRVLQRSGDVLELLDEILNILLHTFPCSRAFLMHTHSDPSGRWSVPLEQREPSSADSPFKGREFIAGDGTDALFERLSTGERPAVWAGKELEPFSRAGLTPAGDLLVKFISPRGEDRWILCLEHRGGEGEWNSREKNRFGEICHRVENALNGLSLYREIRENEAFLSEVFESIPQMTFIKDAEDLRFLRFNRAGEELLGLRRDDIIGKSDHDLFPPEVADGFTVADREVLSSGEMRDVPQEKIHNSRGEERILHTKKVSIRDNGGTPRYLFGISEDITEKIRMENELIKTRVWLDSFIDCIDYGFIIFDREARIVLINEKVRSYQPPGWDKERLIGLTMEEFIALTPPLHSPVYGEGFFLRYREILGTGRSVESEIYQTLGGKTYWFHTRIFSLLNGFALVSRDITEQKEAEGHIRDTNDRLESFLNSASNMMGLFDRDRNLVLTNERTRQYLVRDGKEEDLRGISLEEFSRRLGNEAVVSEKLRHLEATAEAVYFESQFPFEGRMIWLSCRFFPSAEGIGFIISDISEVRKLEEQLLQVQKIESIGRLAGGIAHDFNNMLSIIMGYTDMAQAEAEDGESVRTYLDEVMKAARRSAQLTQQLLAFARKQNIQPRIINLNETIPGMLKIMKSLIGEQIELIWRPGTNLPSIEIDPSQVDQIIANLCVNSRDAIEDTGVITLSTEDIVLDSLYSAVHPESQPGRYAVLSVTDDGAGMDRETRDKIFEPFFTTKDVGKGTGLGLSTVYGIIRQNRGFVTVYSEPGLGTTMKIFFPAAEDGDALSPPEEAEDSASGGGESLLIVEDEKIILSMAASILRSLGYRVFTADNAEAALRIAGDSSTVLDLIITDVIMPEMNGRELKEKVELLQPDALFLYMSGYTADIIEKHGVLDRETHFLQKPFTRPSLASKVREVLDSQKKAARP